MAEKEKDSERKEEREEEERRWSHLPEEEFLDFIEEKYSEGKFCLRVGELSLRLNPPDPTDTDTDSNSSLTGNSRQSIEERDKECFRDQYDHFLSVPMDALSSISLCHQAILFCGESGSGKTKCFDQSLSFLALKSMEVDSDHTGLELEKKIAAISIIFELFGHAQTPLNSNSTRFIKSLKMKIKNGKILSAEVSQYLLEKKRLISQTEGESNFHIFYALFLPSFQSKLNLDLRLNQSLEYRYIYPQDRLDNPEELTTLEAKIDQLLEALTLIGFDLLMQKQLFQALAGVLLLGNVVFRPLLNTGRMDPNIDDVECCLDESLSNIPFLVELLGKEDIAEILTAKVIQGGRASVYKVALTGAQARANADALAQFLFSQLFNWIITCINSSLGQRNEGSGLKKPKVGGTKDQINHISLIDLTGFEDSNPFNEDLQNLNGLEQFLVNYWNEKIYSVFYADYFQKENDLFFAENCPFFIPYGSDNSECISLYDNEKGLLKLIDEHSLLSRANRDDMTLLNLFCNTLSSAPEKNQSFKCSLMLKKKVSGDQTFMIKHFAHETRYCIQGFTIGNVDKNETDDYLKLSTNTVVSLSMKSEEERESDLQASAPENSLRNRVSRLQKQNSTSAMGKKNKKSKSTLCQSVKTSLATLLSEISGVQRHFIWCIKTRYCHSEEYFDRSFVLQQLRYSGLFDSLRMKYKGYNIRCSWRKLASDLFRQGCITKDITSNLEEYLKPFLKTYLPPETWFAGKSGTVFLQNTVFFELKQKHLDICAGKIQKSWKIRRIPPLLHQMFVSLQVIKKTLMNYFVKMRYQRSKKENFQAKLNKYYLLKRWQLLVRLKKRLSAKIIMKILQWKKTKERIHKILKAQETISTFLQSKRIRRNFLHQKKSAIQIQASTRGFFSRKKSVKLIEEVRLRMELRLRKNSAQCIYSCFRNYQLKKQFTSVLLSIRWKDLKSCVRILSLYPDLIFVRDSTNGFKTLLQFSIACEFIECVEFLLAKGSSPFTVDLLGSTALLSLAFPPTKRLHAEILSLLISYYPNIFDFAEHEDILFHDCEEYIKTKSYYEVPCLSSNLGSVLLELQRAKKRALGKARHREAMRRGSTIIPLYNPADWKMPLPLSNLQDPMISPQQASLASYAHLDQSSGILHRSSSLVEHSAQEVTPSVKESSSGLFIPPRRKRNPESVNRRSLIQTTPSYSRSPAVASLSPKLELFHKTGDINSDAIYKTLFDEDLNQSKIFSVQNSPESPPMALTPHVEPVPHTIPPVVVQIPSPLYFSEAEEPSPLSRNTNKIQQEKKQKPIPDKQKSVPLTLDPQYRLLLARKKAIEKDPVLDFLMKSRPSNGLKLKKKS